MHRTPPYNIHIRTGVMDGSDIQHWNCGRVERRVGLEWKDLAEFSHYSPDGTFTSFIIELIYDSVAANFDVSRRCQDGGTPFCVCAHVGGQDVPGVALRRWTTPEGLTAYRKIECDPAQCELRLLHTTSNRSESSKKLPPIYKELYKDLKYSKKGDPPMCKPAAVFMFRLLLPDGSDYAHGPFEVAALTTSSDKTRGLIWEKLEEMYVECGGHLAGLRLELRALLWEAPRFDKTFTAWELRPLDEGTIMEQRIKQGQRLMLRRLDPVKLADQTETSLALIEQSGEYSLAQLGLDEAMQSAIDLKKAEMELQAFEAAYIDPSSVELPTDSPWVKKLVARMNLSYAEYVALPLQFGYDAHNVVMNLIRKCQAHNKEHKESVFKQIPYRDIYEPYLESMGIELPAKAAPAAPKQEEKKIEQPAPDSAIQEAEFTEPIACPKCNKPAYPRPDGSINCPGCEEEAKTASDIGRVIGQLPLNQE